MHPNSPLPRFLVGAASLCLGCLATAGASHAQCVATIHGVPDFDQQRAAATGIPGLPDNGGHYCAPTTATDWMAYLANHGFPGVFTGPRDWQSSANYNLVTGQIFLTGVLMQTGTTPQGGTPNVTCISALQTILMNGAPGKFIVVSTQASGDYGPTPFELYLDLLVGGMPDMCRGAYEVSGENADHFTQYEGHHMALYRVQHACAYPTTVK